MKLLCRFLFIIFTACVLLILSTTLQAASKITMPKQQFGVNIGDDYQLINYTQLEAYWKKLADESPRMKLVEMGKTAEGRTQWMAIVTAPKNFEKLEEYKAASRRLALAENLSDAEAKKLAETSKSVIWIDGGLHSTEVVGAQQLSETLYQIVSLEDAETLRFLEDSIILFVPANPDGMELVSNWYMREADPKKRTTATLPRLYQKYIGHDNNRDHYMLNQPESENMANIMYREWFPQIMYNHHQRGPGGSIVYIPPFRDPPNYNYDPLLILGNQTVGLAMHSRLVAENKGGSVARGYASFSTWYNGSLRTTGYFHNQIGILTEINGTPAPMDLPLFPDMLLPSNDHALPIMPRKWHFRESIDYSVTLNRAVLDYASRNRETLLYNRYQMGRNGIARGSKDHWTIQPRTLYEVEEAVSKDEKANAQVARRRGDGISKNYLKLFSKPEDRDPRAFIISSQQKDFSTAVKFVNTLIKNGVKVHQAKKVFTVGAKQYPAGTFVVQAAQAFRSHVMDMFEPQDHPDEFLYKGGAPIPPYDNAGWTLAFQMGVEFDRLLVKVEGPFEELKDLAKPLEGYVATVENAKGYLLDHGVNDSMIAVNRLLASGHKVYWLQSAVTANHKQYPIGTIYVEAKESTANTMQEMASSLGLNIDAISVTPKTSALQIQPVRIGLWDRFGGSMPSGWTRWIMEQLEFPFEVVYPQGLDKGDLNKKFDALVFVTGGIDYRDGEKREPRPYEQEEPNPKTIPAEYRDKLGKVSKEKTLPQIEKFLQAGGSVMAIGESISIENYLNLPIDNHMTDSKGKPLSSKEFFVPSSILQVRVDNTQPVAYGVTERVDLVYDESPVMRLQANADKKAITPIAWFDSDKPLRSGWAWQQDRLFGGTAIAHAKVGKGDLYLYGPEVLYRGQSHGTYQLLFNAVYLANAKSVKIGNE